MAPLDCGPQEVGPTIDFVRSMPWRRAGGRCRDEGLMWRLHGRPTNAYRELAPLGARLIMTYAMCVFANFGSLSILIGALVDGSRAQTRGDQAWVALERLPRARHLHERCAIGALDELAATGAAAVLPIGSPPTAG